MSKTLSDPAQLIGDYIEQLSYFLKKIPSANVIKLVDKLKEAWKNRQQVFIFGNGGSAGNAIHLANDLIYGVSKSLGSGIKIHALPANQSILTCLANDEGYDQVFAHQIAVYANPGDLAIALSGSGNSPNILRALETSEKIGLETFAILGFDGGKAKALAKYPIELQSNDMQVSEDLQLIVGHMVMKLLLQSNS